MYTQTWHYLAQMWWSPNVPNLVQRWHRHHHFVLWNGNITLGWPLHHWSPLISMIMEQRVTLVSNDIMNIDRSVQRRSASRDIILTMISAIISRYVTIKYYMISHTTMGWYNIFNSEFINYERKKLYLVLMGEPCGVMWELYRNKLFKDVFAIEFLHNHIQNATIST